jgi:hypothetical protein
MGGVEEAGETSNGNAVSSESIEPDGMSVTAVTEGEADSYTFT